MDQAKKGNWQVHGSEKASAKKKFTGLRREKRRVTEDHMAEIKEHMKVIGKDGTHVGTVDRVEGDHIKLTKKDSPAGNQGHHHYIDRKLVGAVEGDTVKLSVNADAVPKTEEAGQKA
jgi:hypothetical protein